MRKTLAGIILLLLSFTLFAQHDSATSKDLDEIVVTATRSERKLGNIAVPVQLISQKTIQQTGSLSFQNILQEQTGIVVVNSNLGTSLNGYPSPFGQGVQMLGLDPAYTLILLDGEPLVGRNAGILKLGRLATGNIRQVEIVKGPSSSLYGSEAMAGVINIITNSPLKEKLDLQLHSGSNNTWAGTIGYSNKLNKTGIQFFLNRLSTSGYDLDPALYGKTADPYRDWNGQVKITHDFSNKLQWLTSLRSFDSKQDNNYEISWQNNPAIVKGYTAEKDKTAFTQLRWNWKSGHKIYFRTFYNRYNNLSFVNLDKTNIRFDETTFNQSILKPEIQFEKNNGKNGNYVAGIGSYFEMIDASRYAGKKNNTTVYAFTQKEWNLLQQKLSVIAGARVDKRNDFSARVSPRIGLAFKPSNHWKLTASSGWGFKAPDFRHLYLNFYNAQIGYSLLGSQTLSGELLRLQQQGQLQAGADITPYEKDITLKPENSFGSHVGVKFTNARWVIEGGIFRNDIHNLIDVYALPFTKINSQQIFSYHNIGRVCTQGADIDFKYKFTNQFSISGGYQFLDAKDKDVLQKIKDKNLYSRDPVSLQTTLVTRADYFGLFNRSHHSANLKFLYDNIQNGWNFYLRFIYRGKFGSGDKNGNNIADDKSELVNGFIVGNLAVAKTINDKFQLQGGVENIFDYMNAQEMPNLPGRVFFLNINYSIEKKLKHKK